MDNVVNGRMPILEDLDKLPFVDALTKEILRFRPVLPLALPHHIKEDIIVRLMSPLSISLTIDCSIKAMLSPRTVWLC